jgi:hypothetical protein
MCIYIYIYSYMTYVYIFVRYVNKFNFVCVIAAKIEVLMLVIYLLSKQPRFVLSSRRHH